MAPLWLPLEPAPPHDPRLARVVAELIGGQCAHGHVDPRQGRPALIVREPRLRGGLTTRNGTGAGTICRTAWRRSRRDLPE